ncbi:MAG: hypothetical protein ACXVC6_03575 [Bacteroidia bacterium]
MRFFVRNILFIFLLTGFVAVEKATAQETKEHKRMWRRFGRKRHPDAFNPNVKHGKSTHEQSRKQKREDDKAIRRAKKEYKKSIKRSARKLHGRK